MKITFNTQGMQETEKQYTDKTRMTRSEKAAGAYQTSFFVSHGNDRMQGFQPNKEKGKSLIELQQEAANTNVAVQQDYMTVMSHTMSEEDYARLEEEGFHFQGLDPEEAVTIVDKIKAELARSGEYIAGYNDDLDRETLAAAVGSDALAKAISDSFQAADIPATSENVDSVMRAWELASQLETPGDGSCHYMIDNGLEPEIWNLYLAQSSGAQSMTGAAPQYYAEDIQGYFTQSANAVSDAALQQQMDKVITDAGLVVNEENREAAQWLVEKKLPVTADNLLQLQELRSMEFPVTEDAFARAAAAAIVEGKNPIHANLVHSENIYDKAAAFVEKMWDDTLWLEVAGDITARKQLEEIRLRMTAEVNIKLLKSGFSIDTAPMEQLVEALKKAEAEVANSYFPEDGQAVEKYQLFHQTQQVVKELPQLPAQVLGPWSLSDGTGTLSQFHAEGKVIQETYVKATESYETLMTAPRSDMGDSIKKAFANVDDILTDMGLELTWENQRAIRILGYNRMAMSMENINSVKAADEQVRHIVEKMTPAATLKMIRDGVNPLENTFAELEEYFDSLPEEYEDSATSYSRFLYQLEQHKDITAQEREAYIGIYRLLHQIEKSDGAVIGALVNSQAELQFQNLLSAVRSNRFKHMDVKATDETGFLQELVRQDNSISQQITNGIEAAKQAIEEVEQNQQTQNAYRHMELEQVRQAANADEEVIHLLQKGEIPVNAGNLLAAQALVHDGAAPFKRWKDIISRKDTVQNMSTDTDMPEVSGELAHSQQETVKEALQLTEELTGLWENMDDKDVFRNAYAQKLQEFSEMVEEVTFDVAEDSVDVRQLQLVHKQLSVAVALAQTEEYVLPMYIGDDLTKVHLTLERGKVQKGQVSIQVDLNEEEHVEAHLQLKEGKISGFLVGNTSKEVTKLQETADIFHKFVERDASLTWEVGELPIVSGIADVRVGRTFDKVSDVQNDAYKVDNAEFYGVAKLFLQAMKE